MNDDRYYAVRLLWVRDQELYTEYQEKTKPLLAKHEVHIERWIMTSDMDGEGFDRPDQIVVTWFKNAESKAALESDPEFVEAENFRDKAAKLITITGNSVFGD